MQDRIAHREKIRLMRQFFYGVSFYVIATLLVLFLPIFVSSVVDKTMLILQVRGGARFLMVGVGEGVCAGSFVLLLLVVVGGCWV